MIKTLYDCFRHWSDGGSVYLYSDFHFDDGDCKLMDPNWITPQEQVDIINKMAHKSDTLIVLGDVGNAEWVKKIKAGYKVLIMGNHDSGRNNYLGYFDEVYTGPLMISDKIILSHEPIPNLDWALNIHGHDHGGADRGFCYHNVCSNVVGYRPVNLDTIIKSGVLNKITSLHRQVINYASENGYDFER